MTWDCTKWNMENNLDPSPVIQFTSLQIGQVKTSTWVYGCNKGCDLTCSFLFLFLSLFPIFYMNFIHLLWDRLLCGLWCIPSWWLLTLESGWVNCYGMGFDLCGQHKVDPMEISCGFILFLIIYLLFSFRCLSKRVTRVTSLSALRAPFATFKLYYRG